ncbi:unnamed protein product [Lathyrus sativus]|nr:unnamed protein product [Lathyrus sativus]
MSPFNCPGRMPMTSSSYPNYSGMGRTLSFNTQDLMKMQDILREPSENVPKTSTPQTPCVNQQRGERVQRVMVPRGCGTGGRYDSPGRQH